MYSISLWDVSLFFGLIITSSSLSSKGTGTRKKKKILVTMAQSDVELGQSIFSILYEILQNFLSENSSLPYTSKDFAPPLHLSHWFWRACNILLGHCHFQAVINNTTGLHFFLEHITSFWKIGKSKAGPATPAPPFPIEITAVQRKDQEICHQVGPHLIPGPPTGNSSKSFKLSEFLFPHWLKWRQVILPRKLLWGTNCERV